MKKIVIYQLQENDEKLHGASWKNSYFTLAGVFMLGFGCCVYQYPQFYVKDLDMYQVLPHTYLGSFDAFPGGTLI